jgi:adenine-specific DNA-methyltransferase
MPKVRKSKPAVGVEKYNHPEAEVLMRPEVGTQAQFRKKKAPKTYRYDSSLSPALDWDGQNSSREEGETLIRQILESESLEDAKAAAGKLKTLSRPFLNWSGKAERLSFDVPTLPLFVHERLSTKAIVETLTGHKRDKQKALFELFSDPQHSITDQLLRAYEHRDQWVNRMILGDSLVVMNSLLEYEGLAAQVQMIYMDPPYGVKFGSNFQPFIRKREVSHGDDKDMTREPEMVKAYRDTWELGLHSYLSYMRDRLVIARELLAPTGSIFVQISDENLHRVRELMDEIYGQENFIVTVVVRKKGGQKSDMMAPIADYLLWYTKNIEAAKEAFAKYYVKREFDVDALEDFGFVEFPDGRVATLDNLSTEKGFDYSENPRRLRSDFPDARFFDSKDLTVGGYRKNQSVLFEFRGRTFDPGIDRGLCWKHTAVAEGAELSGMERLARSNRLFIQRDQIRFKRYFEDFPYIELSNLWTDVGGAKNRIYVVQTNPEIVKRCMLMTTRPGDLVLDPTCGSGTTAYVAEQWGRRWITVDVSRVPLALARQRLLSATFEWYELQDDSRGPAGGFVYKRRQNKSGDDFGGIVPHVTSSSIANDEPPEPTVLVDRPEKMSAITRVTGPFCVEATIPTPVDWEGDGVEDSRISPEQYGSFVDRMLEVLRKSPVLHLEKNRTVNLKNVRPPAKTLSLNAEATVANGEEKPVAFVFGPENGAVSEKLVYEAAREGHLKNYSHLYVIGFAIEPNARELVEKSSEAVGIPATYVQATPDLMMGDLLKTMRSSQIFSVCGLPEVEVRSLRDGKYEVELIGTDTFDPITMEVDHKSGDDVPAWFLDTDYNGLCFHVSQAFFPRTGAWDNLKKALKAQYEESVWEHLAGAVSAPFEAGDNRRIAVKVIDDRGNELLVEKDLP